MIAPPLDRHELFGRAEKLAGSSLGTLAAMAGLEVPEGLARAKGFVGQLLEGLLGATAKSRAEPDFPELGIELKSLPVDRLGRPLETTFVCTVEMRELMHIEWEASRLHKKLAHVLWIPVLGERAVPVGDRIVGAPVLWEPNEHERAALRADWELLASFMATGRTGELDSKLGTVMQVRPKAARGSSRRRVQDEEGALYDEQPKGFYLRKEFTGRILREALVLPR